MEAALAGSGRHQWMGQVGSGIGGMGPDRGELASVGDAANGPPDERSPRVGNLGDLVVLATPELELGRARRFLGRSIGAAHHILGPDRDVDERIPARIGSIRGEADASGGGQRIQDPRSVGLCAVVRAASRNCRRLIEFCILM